jgi:hypothetical protein
MAAELNQMSIERSTVEMCEQRIQEPEKDDDSECDKSGAAKQNIKRKPI